MNAVIDKPRAKVAKRAAPARKVEPPLVTITDIRQWIGTAEVRTWLRKNSCTSRT